MAKIHKKLKPFEPIKRVKTFNVPLIALEKDLNSIGCNDFQVEVSLNDEKMPFMDQFLSFRSVSEADSSMQVAINTNGRDACLVVPQAEGRLQPFLFEIDLDVPSTRVARYVQGFIGKKWEVDPEDDEFVSRLKSLKLPNIRWRYSHGAYKWKLSHAFTIMPKEDSDRTLWQINSGYTAAGFLGGLAPKISPFLEAASQLEEFLARH